MPDKNELVRMIKKTYLGKMALNYKNRLILGWFSAGCLVGLTFGYSISRIVNRVYKDNIGSKHTE
uniref:Uncharacterized protein n=1 Tax=viral metagenome TaxID=1070528 RepID=A0A6C0K898_9ZZZZ